MKNLKYIDVKTENKIGIISLNNSEELNTLCYAIFDEIYHVLKSFEENNEIRIILINAKSIISKSGKKIFSAGVNLKDYESKFKLVKENIAEFEKKLLKVRKILSYIENHPKTIIAAVDGVAIGGAFEMILSCDIILASTDAKFALSEVKIGLIPGYGGIHRLEELMGSKKAHYYMALGDLIKAKTAYDIGIVSELIEIDSFHKEVLAICNKLAHNSPNALMLLKKTLKNNKTADPEKVEPENFLKAISHNDAQIGVNSFLNKLMPTY
ncbi:MAG: enoyl-CoA hydratase/isomerase family protein [bacterium]